MDREAGCRDAVLNSMFGQGGRECGRRQRGSATKERQKFVRWCESRDVERLVLRRRTLDNFQVVGADESSVSEVYKEAVGT